MQPLYDLPSASRSCSAVPNVAVPAARPAGRFAIVDVVELDMALELAPPDRSVRKRHTAAPPPIKISSAAAVRAMVSWRWVIRDDRAT